MKSGFGTPAQTYEIRRFRFDRPGAPEVIKRGLSLDEAQAWCTREDTHGDGWFDGYEAEGDGVLDYDDEDE